jgi:hypothetical protein
MQHCSLGGNASALLLLPRLAALDRYRAHVMLADHCNCAAAPTTRRTITASSGRAPAAAAQLLAAVAPRLQPTISLKSLNASSDATDPASAPSQLSALIDSLQSGGGADAVSPELLDALAAFLAQEATADALLAAAEAGDADLAALLDEPPWNRSARCDEVARIMANSTSSSASQVGGAGGSCPVGGDGAPSPARRHAGLTAGDAPYQQLR